MPNLARTIPKFQLKSDRIGDNGVVKELRRLLAELDSFRTDVNNAVLDMFTAITFAEGARSSDPDDPAAGYATMWVSDGTGSGDDGDLIVKITDSNGTTKTITLIDFSAY
jgi:hypothetical protein